MCFSSGGDPNKYAALARQDEQARQARITSGIGSVEKAFKGIEPMLAARGQAYADFANPQLEQQFTKQNENLNYALARKGLTSSSEAARGAGDLQNQYNMGRAAIAGESMNQTNAARTQAEQNKSDLIAQLNATGDARLAASSAVNRAGMLANAPGFSPIGNLFQQGTGLLSSAAQAGYYDPNAKGLGMYGITQPRRTPTPYRTVQ
jgi:hypothetical protein